MFKVLALSLAMGFSGAAFAKADCTAHPKSEWIKESDAKAQLEAQRYKIRKFKIDGNCYEIYGHDKNGKKVEIYYDTKTLAVVKSEVE
ncbi:PepSY domain-containing protein [Caballeronia sp. TF1N1]|uniref:PepSY domain-containing protein n=1 Tax=Caballeronia sp. TF1N1 TaxID=2878153 RepID=UPI001FD07323|nr:PepSY domain-containing protein [Caballeronia sp. TF1N1]